MRCGYVGKPQLFVRSSIRVHGVWRHGLYSF